MKMCFFSRFFSLFPRRRNTVMCIDCKSLFTSARIINRRDENARDVRARRLRVCIMCARVYTNGGNKRRAEKKEAFPFVETEREREEKKSNDV